MNYQEQEYVVSEWMVAEPTPPYGGAEYPMSKETYEIIGFCMEIHRTLGAGLSRIAPTESPKLALKFFYEQRA